MTHKIKLILVDDHRIFRDGMKALLVDQSDIEVVDEASDGKQLLDILNQTKVDLVILDISMPGMSGIETTKLISEKFPEVRVMILSMHTNDEFVFKATQAGAKAYLPKDTSKTELLEAIRCVAQGAEYFSKSISDSFLKNAIQRSRAENHLMTNEDLTLREIEILKLVASGITHKEIADMLFISPKTVDAHKNHIMQKLKLKNTAELVLYAVSHKIIEVK